MSDPLLTPSRQVVVREDWLAQVREDILEPTLPIIDPNDPENSLLYNKLLDPPVCGQQMPFLTSKKLTATDKQCILDWIKGVAGIEAADGG